jgi:hypothetical protein
MFCAEEIKRCAYNIISSTTLSPPDYDREENKEQSRVIMNLVLNLLV